MRYLSINNTTGFTVVELIIVITVSGILAGLIFGPLDDLYYSNAKSISKVSQVTDTRSSLRSIQHLISLSNGFLTENSVPDANPDKSWTATNGGINNVLITNNYATDIEPGADTNNERRLVFQSNCTTPVSNNYVYFVQDRTLYRRTLTGLTAATPTCNSLVVAQKRTCVSGYASTTYKDNCQGTDAKILDNVDSFTIDYYVDPADTTTATDPTAAKTVVLKVKTTKGTGNNAISSESNLRITRVN